MKSVIGFFQSLRGKLILTYTIVTVLALLALEITILFFGVILSRGRTSSVRSYLNDVVMVLGPQAESYLAPGHVDPAGLGRWLTATYESGYASLPPQYFMDNPAALIMKNRPMLVLSPDGSVLAAEPSDQSQWVGKKYAPPDEVPTSPETLASALHSDTDPSNVSALDPQGNYWMAVPVLQKNDSSSHLLGVIILTVKAPPPYVNSVLPVFVVVVLLTGLVLLVGVTPFGAVFGLIMSRGLTSRLKALTRAADAWSEGDFSFQPQDRAKDEISYLAMRMRRMAEHIQQLMQSQHELALMEERNRLARELHDTVKQETFATLMQVRAAKNLIDSDPASARARLEEAEELIKSSQKELGMMISELRPAGVEGDGLAEALRRYLSTWSQHSCIPSEILVQNEQRLPLEIEQMLFRVAQEALSNVARHSRASMVTVTLAYEADHAALTTADNGAGFDPAVRSGPGFGIQSMRERMASIGGELVLTSTPGAGTIVTARCSIPRRN